MKIVEFNMWSSVFFLLLTFQFTYSITEGSTSLATTNYGTLKGSTMTSRSGRVFKTFLGVPFAAAPVDSFRFLPPQPPKPWEGIRDALEEAPACLQRGPKGAEDCLYLNIFTHSTDKTQMQDVIVYIHGGGFNHRSAEVALFGPQFFMDEDIVVVSIQYRLGLMGFLSTEDSVIPGNMGMKDQVQALRWIKENIQGFGGDPAKVTLVGLSAGASSVHLHMQSPLSQDLFIRGVSESGVAFSSFSIANRGYYRNATLKIASKVNCPTEGSEILSCLQSKESTEMQSAYDSLVDSKYYFHNILFRPVIEEEGPSAFLTIKARKTKTVKPWITGINSEEGLYRILKKNVNKTLHLIEHDFPSFLSQLMIFDNLYEQSEKERNAELTYDFYFKNASSTEEKTRKAEQILSDAWFSWPVELAIQRHVGPLYYYLYDHLSEHPMTTYFNSALTGVAHGEELRVFFSQKKYFPNELNEVDCNISQMMIKLWVNFAKTGNPTPHPISSNPQVTDEKDFIWNSTSSVDPTHMLIQTNKLSLHKHLFGDRVQFWKQFKLLNDV